MAAKKDFSKDAADIFGLRERREMEARQRERAAQEARVEAAAPETEPVELEAPVAAATPIVSVVQTPPAVAPKKVTRKPASTPVAVSDATDTLTTKTFRITRRQHKALQMRMAMSDDPAEKDLSSIVRAALDVYLRGELEGMA